MATWHDASYCGDAEWAALALTKAATRCSDRADPEPDIICEEAAKHDEQPAPAASIANAARLLICNCLSFIARQLAESWAG